MSSSCRWFWLLALGCSACSRCDGEAEPARDPIEATASAAAPPAAQEDPETAAAREMLERFVQPGADHRALSEELIPREADYDAVFLPEAADAVHAIYAPRFDRGELVIQPAADQTEVRVYHATTEELRGQSGQSQRFPAGYRSVADKLQPELDLYTFAFVPEGGEPGLVYDGLVRLGNRWVIFPKLWQALR